MLLAFTYGDYFDFKHIVFENVRMFYWDPRPEIFVIPYANWPVLWYGVLFGLGFALGFPVFVSILRRFFSLCTDYSVETARQKAFLITDRLIVYMVSATVIGARLGHLFFYERPEHYLSNPLEIFKVWEGGLASHGAVIAVIVALILFERRIRSVTLSLSWVRLLDFVSIPAALCGCAIRIGNFFNQEILGTATDLPWGVVFGHPMDRSLLIARHPVQIYEALFYFFVFCLLWRLSYIPRFLKNPGKLIGLFLMLVFGFRFLVEYLKLEQSPLVSSPFLLTMGQMLSIPAILLGIFFYRFYPVKKTWPFRIG